MADRGIIDKMLAFNAVKLKGSIQMEKVWENASPTSAFAAQTIQISKTLNEGDLIAIKATRYTDYYGEGDISVFPVSNKNCMINTSMAVSNKELYAYGRVFHYSAGEIVFETGYMHLTSVAAVGTAGAKYCIPLEIYIIKGVI